MANKLLKKKTTIQKIVKKQKATTPAAVAKVAKPGVVQHFTIPSGEFVAAVGRRKTATARIRLHNAPGDFVVNDKLVSDYFQGVANASSRYTLPFSLVDGQGKYAVTVKVNGSGLAAQLGAVIHGVSRALIKLNPEFRPVLKKQGLLTRDDRMKETRKIGTGGKARRTKQSPKR